MNAGDCLWELSFKVLAGETDVLARGRGQDRSGVEFAKVGVDICPSLAAIELSIDDVAR